MVEISSGIDDKPIVGKKREDLPLEHEGDLVSPTAIPSSEGQTVPPKEEQDHGNGPITTIKGTQQPY